MTKRIVSFVLVLCMILTFALALTSCHGNKQPLNVFDVPENFDTSKEYELTFWAKHESIDSQKDAYTKAVSDFEKLYPNIKVNLKFYTKYPEIYRDVLRNISTKTTPNICISYPDHVATYLETENSVVPLDSLISDKKYGLGGSEIKFDAPNSSEIVSRFLDECVIDECMYAMPFMRSSEALYINKDLLLKLVDEIPEVITWADIWKWSEMALEKNADGTYKVNGDKVLIPIIYQSSDNMMIQMLKQRDAGYSTEDGEILIFNDDTREILDEIADAVDKKIFATHAGAQGYPGDFLNQGQCIFAIDSTAGATWIGSGSPNLDIDSSSVKNFETIVRPIPQYDAENPKMISQGPSLCIFNKEDPNEVLASWLFVQYLLTNDIQIGFAQSEGYVPVTTKAQKDPEYLDYLSRAGEKDEQGKAKLLYYDVKIAATKLVLNNIDNTFVTPAFSNSTSLRYAAGIMIDEVEKSIKRKETVDDSYIDALFEKMISIHHLEGMIVNDEFPTASIVLLASIGGVWCLMGGALLFGALRNYKKSSSIRNKKS